MLPNKGVVLQMYRYGVADEKDPPDLLVALAITCAHYFCVCKKMRSEHMLLPVLPAWSLESTSSATPYPIICSTTPYWATSSFLNPTPIYVTTMSARVDGQMQSLLRHGPQVRLVTVEIKLRIALWCAYVHHDEVTPYR